MAFRGSEKGEKRRRRSVCGRLQVFPTSFSPPKVGSEARAGDGGQGHGQLLVRALEAEALRQVIRQQELVAVDQGGNAGLQEGDQPP